MLTKSRIPKPNPNPGRDARGRKQHREISGRPFTAKNFRTWAGSVHAAAAVCDLPPVASETGYKRNIVRAIDAVAAKLGNTRAVCRKSYVHPAVFDAYRAGHTIAAARNRSTGTRRAHFSPQESAVLNLLKSRARPARRESVAA